MRPRRLYLALCALLTAFIAVAWLRSHYASDYVQLTRETRGKESWRHRSLSLMLAKGSFRLNYESLDIGPAASAVRNNYPEKTSLRFRTALRLQALEPTSIPRTLGFGFNNHSRPGGPAWELWLPHWLFLLLFALPLWLAYADNKERHRADHVAHHGFSPNLHPPKT
jgi:hypothetical protein